MKFSNIPAMSGQQASFPLNFPMHLYPNYSLAAAPLASRPLKRLRIDPTPPPQPKTGTAECSNCRDQSLIVNDTQGRICTGCGIVVSRNIIETAEWRSFADDDGTSKGDPNRIGGVENALLEAYGLSTMVSALADGNSNHNNNNSNSILNKGRGEELKVIVGMSACNSLCGRMDISNRMVMDRVKLTVKQLIQSGKANKRNVELMVAAALYCVCRMSGVKRSINEIEQCSDCPIDKLNPIITMISRLGLVTEKNTVKVSNVSESEQFASRFCSQLDLNDFKFTVAVGEIAENAKKLPGNSSRRVTSLVGAAIYLACQIEMDKQVQMGIRPTMFRSFEEIAPLVFIQPSTLQNIYRTCIYPQRSLLVPLKFANIHQVQSLTLRLNFN